MFPSTATIIGGPYTVTWNSLALGIMEGDQGVPTVVTRSMARMVESSDQYGAVQLGGFYLGARGRAMMRCLEYDAATIGASWPWGVDGALGVVGRDLYELSKTLLLTRASDTNSFTPGLTPATLEAQKAILAPDHDVTLMFGPMVRTVPLEFILFPYGSAPGTLYTKS